MQKKKLNSTERKKNTRVILQLVYHENIYFQFVNVLRYVCKIQNNL